MYFSSDSWGKLGKEFDSYIKDSVYHEPLSDTKSLKELAKVLFNESGVDFRRLSRPEILKKVLEGIRMPVTNPKTGEQDYVDISLVNKIVVDSQYVEDMVSNNKLKVDVNLTGDKSTNKVSITVMNKEAGLQGTKVIELQEFEEMLFKAINEIKDQRLEEVEDFGEIINNLMNTLVEGARTNQNKHFARLEQEYKLLQGVGIIRDIKTNQEVGTFENATYRYNRNERVLNIEGVILSGRTFEDLEEKDRFEFAFYAIDNETAYSIIASNKSAISASADKMVVDIRKFDLIIDTFDGKHTNYAMVVEAQEKKELLEGIDESHPLYDVNMEQFRHSRLVILEESRNKQKQQKLVSQFADIDLDI
jgi:hypothetical protein